MELTVVGYQFANLVSRPGEFDWDANWLRIWGEVRDGSRAWTFLDPCLTTGEAERLASWLRGLGDLGRAAGEASDPDDRWLEFTEPNLAFALRSSSPDAVVLDVRFDLESRPRAIADDEGRGHVVRLTVSQSDVARAADGWERELARFPMR